ncbi:hypothetical protein HYH03_003458 [Edaphochlamys debaryana]|uniref:Transmembrane protein n=1 Tax=Edaphochlamys debaryana TaxID=47281 RepID=A0A836C4B4_9CHLO|nr:hypothetical protein HYH03_003458 [Edaphochlamys debaryana]|eukprot:KAG2498718.1 hypothetical protein HYH03_003458 [Edaphochlamys debaryana]
MRQRAAAKDSAAEEPVEFLDEQEQEQLIREFEDQQRDSQRTWRAIFGTGCLAMGLFFLYAACRQQLEPFGVRFTGELRSAAPAGPWVAAVLGLQGVALLLSGWGLLSEVPPRKLALGAARTACLPYSARQAALLWSGVGAAAVGAVFWSCVMGHLLAKEGAKVGARWELLWLPAGPLAGCLLCCHVASSLADTEKEIQKLKSQRYNYKKL